MRESEEQSEEWEVVSISPSCRLLSGPAPGRHSGSPRPLKHPPDDPRDVSRDVNAPHVPRYSHERVGNRLHLVYHVLVVPVHALLEAVGVVAEEILPYCRG